MQRYRIRLLQHTFRFYLTFYYKVPFAKNRPGYIFICLPTESLHCANFQVTDHMPLFFASFFDNFYSYCNFEKGVFAL